jgi:DNA polymerase III delta subunit
MIYFFYGPDSYRRNEKLKSTLAEYRKKYPVSDLAVIDLEDEPDNWMKARDFLNQPSMFVDSKVLVIKESGAVSPTGEGKEWLRVLKSNLEAPRTFVLISDAKKPLKAFGFLVEPPSKTEFFGELDGRLLEVFVNKETARLGLKLDGNALSFLLGYLAGVSERSWVAVRELERIALAGFPDPVGFADLKKITSAASSDEVFEVAREISWSRNRTSKMGLLEKLLLQKKEPAHIFNSLAYQAKGMEIVRFADYDAAIKSGNMDYEEALLDFVL